MALAAKAALLGLAVFFSAAAAFAEPEPTPVQAISLKVGARAEVSVSNVSRVAVADPSVADIKVHRDVLEVVGRAAGTTEVLVWKADGGKVTYPVTVTR